MDQTVTAPGADTRSTITRELLAQPWILSQRRALTVRDFRDAAKRRGLTISDEGLELLHRRGILVPWLRVERDVAEIHREVRRKTPSPWRWELMTGQPSTDAPALIEEWDAGRVADGATSAFEPWKRRTRTWRDIGYTAWDFLYSPYQLLALPDIEDALRLMNRRRLSTWSEQSLAAKRDAERRMRALVSVLSSIEYVYYADIRRRYTYSHPYGTDGDYQGARDQFSASVVLTASGWSRDGILAAAESLLWTAHSRDPLKYWVDLVSLIDPRKWERLEGEALLAMDFRIAAEMLLRFVEDLAKLGIGPTLPDHSQSRWYHPLQDRLGRRRARLDRTLTDFGISPHPALVMVLEGSTEMYVIEKLMDLFEIPMLDSFIRLTLLGGIDKQIELLARYLAPALGRTQSNLAELDRPPTRLLVVVDQEGRYTTSPQRQRAKDLLVQHLYNALDPRHQSPTALQELAHLVEIQTWGPSVRNIEYAHFTDRAIAAAVVATGKASAGNSLATLTAQVAGLRQGGGNIKTIWRNWPDPKPDKLEVWRHLWPVLRARVRRAQVRGTESQIPLVRVVFDAYRLAVGPRSNIVMRVGP